jgi:hypothetical protein
VVTYCTLMRVWGTGVQIGVCGICSKYVPKQHMQEHRNQCALKVSGK